MTLREARAEYFAANALPPDGGYDARWVRLKIGPIPFAFPNTEGRRRVVRAHDLHHVLTGYRTDIKGEAEIAAWEIGAGCRDRAALQLELRVLGFGLVRWPGDVFRAFVRGRRSKNLLGTRCDDAFVSRSLESVRAELSIDPSGPAPAATADDRRAFRRWALLAVGIVWGPLIPLAALLWWWLR
jgi:hypothetical protein